MVKTSQQLSLPEFLKGVMARMARPYRWRALNLCTMRQIDGTAATLIRAEAAAEQARAKLGSEADLLVAEVFGPAGVLYRYDRRAPSGMRWPRSRG
jgi:hypothetical protein